jgi:competence protein ComEA
VPFPSRRSDDADVIRARLRLLLAEAAGRGGWVPDDPDPWTDPAPSTEPTRSADGDLAPAAARPAGIGRHRPPGTTVRWSPGRAGARSLWLAALVAALVVIGWTWSDRPEVTPAPAAPSGSTAAPSPEGGSPPVGEVAQTSSTVVVSVVGLVARPGLVSLPSGARVADAVEAAGGFLPEADPASVNLAAMVTDGEQIVVGLPGAPVEGGGGGAGAAGAGERVDLNAATAAELDALPGIGPVLAQRIVAYRDAEGPFRSVDQLDDVPGIGPAIAAELADLVTV